jgi:hypothetical protein
MNPNNKLPEAPKSPPERPEHHMYPRMAITCGFDAELEQLYTAPCAFLRNMQASGTFRYLCPEVFEEVLEHYLPGGAIVSTLAEVAAAFDMAPQSVKGDWRDGGMPGRAGHWDLNAILVWRVQRDARSKGHVLQTIAQVLDREMERLSEQYTIPNVLAAAARLSKEWDDTLAECEAEEKKPAPKARNRITN